MIQLDPRLRTAADMVRRGSVTADVGTDHGYLICELVGSGKCPRGYASDIRPLPLEAARGHIREAGLADCIEVVLSDGLRELPGEEIEDVVLAGMGGELIAEILTAVPWTRTPEKRFILQPMTRAEQLRQILYREGFELLDECAVTSGRFIYTVMSAAYTGTARMVDRLFALTGLLLHKQDPGAQVYLEMVSRRLHKQAAGLERSAAAAIEAAGLRTLLAMIEEQRGG